MYAYICSGHILGREGEVTVFSKKGKTRLKKRKKLRKSKETCYCFICYGYNLGIVIIISLASFKLFTI